MDVCNLLLICYILCKGVSMNQDDYITFMAENAEKYSKFMFHPDFSKELENCIKNNRSVKNLFKQLIKNFDFLAELDKEVTQLKNFESLKGTDGLYSMRFISKSYNFRILYSYWGQYYLFLHLFEEKAGKNQTSYSSHNPIAQKRKEELEEEILQ